MGKKLKKPQKVKSSLSCSYMIILNAPLLTRIIVKVQTVHQAVEKVNATHNSLTKFC